jgi:ankyrin repeat protein
MSNISSDDIVEQLVEAAKANDATKIKQILSSGVDINTTGSNGWTALIVSAFNWRSTAVKCLLEAGASSDVSGHSYNTAMSLAKDGASLLRNFMSEADADKASKEIMNLLKSAPKRDVLPQKQAKVGTEKSFAVKSFGKRTLFRNDWG